MKKSDVLQSTSKDKESEFRKASREIYPELTGLMFNEPKMTSRISVECPASYYAFKETVCSKHALFCDAVHGRTQGVGARGLPPMAS